MAQAGKLSTTSRRHFLAGAFSLSLPGGPAALPTTAQLHQDPICLAIERCMRAEREYGDYLLAQHDDDDADEEVRLANATIEANSALVETKPTTQRGLAALTWYVRTEFERGNPLLQDDELFAYLRIVEQAAMAQFLKSAEAA